MTKEMITNDVFDIAKRIKEIDENYFVVYDKKLCRFEVHNKMQKPDTLSLVLPYDRLDCRALDKVLSTRIQHVAKLLEQIDKQNEQLQQKQIKELANKRIEECQEFLHPSSG